MAIGAIVNGLITFAHGGSAEDIAFNTFAGGILGEISGGMFAGAGALTTNGFSKF